MRRSRFPRHGAVEPILVGCGTCDGCRIRRARDYAIRCALEASVHDVSCWVTLTYDDEHLPPSLSRSDLSGFVKRLRRRVEPHRFRFFASGEYGERTHRAHYHAILFGLRDEPRVQECWDFGYTREDYLAPAAIAYVAGYCAKKLGWASERQTRVDARTGERYVWQPPFLQMSLKPGIGAWARKHSADWRDSAYWQGRKVAVPRFLHQSWLDKASEREKEVLNNERSEASTLWWEDREKFVYHLRAGAADAATRLDIKQARRVI